MPLFTIPKLKEHTFTISDSMRVVIDAGTLDESQVKKFSDFPELLDEEIENENQFPDVSNYEKDIFDAVYTNDYHKFFRCVAKVGVRKDLLERVYNWLIAKEDFNPKKDLSLLRRIEGAKSIFSIFDF